MKYAFQDRHQNGEGEGSKMLKRKMLNSPPIRISAELIKELDDLVEKFGYRSRLDLVREAIIDKISELKGIWKSYRFVTCNITKEEAKREIKEYIKYNISLLKLSF